MADGHASNGVNAYKGTAVVGIVIVGTLHQRALRVKIAQLHVDTDWCVEVTENGLGLSCVAKQRTACLYVVDHRELLF